MLVDLKREEIEALVRGHDEGHHTVDGAHLRRGRGKLRAFLDKDDGPLRYLAFCANPNAEGRCWWKEEGPIEGPCLESECDCTPDVFVAVPATTKETQ